MARQGVFQQQGDIIDFLNTGEDTIAAGQVVPLVSRIGFAVTDIAPGAIGGVAVKGVFSDVPSDNTAAFDAGDTLYWDVTANKLTKTATDNTPTGGWSVSGKLLAGTVSVIKLVG
jgi:predicted RecA/RadA family phage recombinase